jgi:hypothetical protein
MSMQRPAVAHRGRTSPRPLLSAKTSLRRAGRGRARNLRLSRGVVLLIVSLLTWSAATLAQPPFSPEGGPPRIDDWIPLDWWSPVQFVSGTLNDDAFDDLAVVLERKQDAPEEKRFERGSSALMILYGDAAGGWRRGPMVPGMLPCTQCSNRLGLGQESALFDLSISADGILEIAWVQQREAMKAVRLFIGWDPSDKGLGLLADDVTLIRPVSGGRSRIRRDYRAGMMWIDGEPRSMPPRFIPIEDITAEQY